MNLCKRSRIATAVLVLSFQSPAVGQVLDAGPQVLTFYSDVDDTEQPYALYLPPNFDVSKQYPLVISLHGAGSNHRLNLRRVFGQSNAEDENDVEASRYFPEWEDVDYIVASPYARGTMGYQGIAEKDVLDVLADVKRRFPIDENRTYLTGLSMGGGGTLWIGLTRPDIWAAIAPVCPAPPRGTDALAPNALHLPVHVFQGAADPVVSPESVREWVERLEELGTQTEYDEYPGVDHFSWVPAYEGGQIFDWFSRFERNPYPNRVRFVSDRYEYDTSYWVQLDALTPGTLARIDAAFTAPNRIEARTSELEGFTLHLAGHPSFIAQEPLVVEIDGTRFELPSANAPSFSRQGERWVAGQAAVQGKRAGAEGPMSEAIASRHIYVYGTDGNPSREELAARRARAMIAAEWSVNRGPFWGRVMVFPRVAADREIRPSDLASANLVLFGTKETNSIIAQFSDRLPLHLDSASQRYGLVYVFPVDGQYMLVNSGLPWWQAGDSDPASRSPFVGDVVAFRLAGLEDYLLFEDSVDNVIAKGRFDTDWQLPAADAERMSCYLAKPIPAASCR
jgi:poly(3-hydroxybutyrate) depolymerase